MPINAFLLMSVGELNENKNHSVVIRAVAKVPGIHYAIAGKGAMRDALNALAEELGISDRVHVLGFRSDIPELYQASDDLIYNEYALFPANNSKRIKTLLESTDINQENYGIEQYDLRTTLNMVNSLYITLIST